MNINVLINKYHEKGPMGLSYSEMNWLFENIETLEQEIEVLKIKIRMHEESLLSIKNSDTLDQAKRTARIALG